MKIVFITDYTPTIDNVNGPSALCFHLLNEWKEKHELHIYSTNSNKVSLRYIEKAQEVLKVHFKIRPRSFWMKLLIYSKTYRLFSPFFPKDMPSVARYRLPSKVKKEIEQLKPDLVIIYPLHLIRVMKQLKKYKIVVIGPDCFMLHNLRALADDYAAVNSTYFNDMVRKIKTEAYVERKAAERAKGVALVGQEDCRLFNKITDSSKAFFLPHPHYNLTEKNICLNKPKLKVVVTGAFNQYTYTDVSLMIKSIKGQSNKLDRLHFTFLGKNWDSIVADLYPYVSVEHKLWVENYIDEIKMHDIQVLPISVGSGTKGKALDALSTGLLCIGSYCAFENIAVTPNKSCIMYEKASDIPQILCDVLINPAKYEQIAVAGRDNVRLNHNPTTAAQIFMDRIINDKEDKFLGKYLSPIKC